MSFRTPLSILTEVDLVDPKMTVADIGSGMGAWTLPLAKIVGPGGRVYAVDIQKELLESINKQAEQEGLSNIVYLWGDIETRGGTKIPDDSVDVAVVANVLFQSQAHYSIALELKRILKPGGKLLIVEWQGSFGGIGPATDMIVTPEVLTKIFGEAGLAVVKTNSVGEYHYAMILRKNT